MGFPVNVFAPFATSPLTQLSKDLIGMETPSLAPSRCSTSFVISASLLHLSLKHTDLSDSLIQMKMDDFPSKSKYQYASNFC